MKVLITGAGGQLGHDLLLECEKRGIACVGIDIKELDITKEDDVDIFLNQSIDDGVDAVIHCAAYTAVDRAEDEPENARNINAVGTRNLAEVCAKRDIKFMYISTDYVFDGEGERPWEPDDSRKPLNVYGYTKYEGELFVEELLKKFFIVRISWVFGLNGNNFIKTMLRLGKEREELSVVDDQIGSPTYTKDLSRLLVDMIQTDKYGRYHASNEGLCSWYDFAGEIFKQAGVAVKVNPVDSGAFPVKAKRPKNSRMSKDKLSENGFVRLPSWEDAVQRYLKELGEI